MNNKIVIWLLNRGRKSNKDERDAFFKRVNDMMKRQAEIENYNNMYFSKMQGPSPHIFIENQNPYQYYG